MTEEVGRWLWNEKTPRLGFLSKTCHVDKMKISHTIYNLPKHSQPLFSTMPDAKAEAFKVCHPLPRKFIIKPLCCTPCPELKILLVCHAFVAQVTVVPSRDLTTSARPSFPTSSPTDDPRRRAFPSAPPMHHCFCLLLSRQTKSKSESLSAY